MTSTYAAAERRPALARRRKRVAALVAEGLSERQIAERLGVSRSTVWNDKQVLAGQSS